MSIRWDARNKRWRYEFDRYIRGSRTRASQLLPRGWSQAKADAFDRTESARLYAVASGVEQSDPLIDEAVALYLRDKTDLKSYRATAEHLGAIAWAYVGKRMSELAAVAAEVRGHTAGARGDTAPATRRNRLACLKAACRFAWRAHGLTAHDPTTRMRLPEVRNERHVYADRRQMLTLARAADRHDVRVLIRAAFYTGMRLGELMRLDVQRDRLVLADTKNGDRRALPTHAKLRTLLPYLPLAAKKTTLQAGFRRARVRAELPHIRLHDLRHSAASEMINAGVDLYTVGVVLGHRDPRSTQRYAHHRTAVLADAVGRIGQKSPHTVRAKAS